MLQLTNSVATQKANKNFTNVMIQFFFKYSKNMMTIPIPQFNRKSTKLPAF